MACCRFLFLCFTLTSRFSAAAQPACIDSVRLEIQPVQCYGLRNGGIVIDKVYQGTPPYYFSLDGVSYSTRPEFDRLWAGEYVLYVRDAQGCQWQQTVQVPEPEELQVQLSVSDDTVTIGQPFTLRAEVVPEGWPLAEISWRPPSLFVTQDTLAQTLSLSQSTVFALEIRDLNDCPARDQIAVTVEKSNLYFPNAFEPGSNQNSWFTVFAGEGVRQVTSLKVFNRAGGLVFERQSFAPNDPLKGWNGRWRGKLVQSGVFLWVAVIEYLDGHEEPFSGTVTVLRDGY